MGYQVCYIHFEINGVKRQFSSSTRTIEQIKDQTIFIKESLEKAGYTVSPIYNAIIAAIEAGNYEVIEYTKSGKPRRRTPVVS